MPNCKTVVPYRGSPEQEERLRQVIAEHRGQPGATMPVLQAAQEIFGYLPVIPARGRSGRLQASCQKLVIRLKKRTRWTGMPSSQPIRQPPAA